MSLKLWRHSGTKQARLYCVLDYPIKAKVWIEENSIYPFGYSIQCFAQSITAFPQKVRGSNTEESKIKVFCGAIEVYEIPYWRVFSWEDFLERALAEENE